MKMNILGGLERVLRIFRLPKNATDVHRVSFWILVAIITGVVAVALNMSAVLWSLSALACGALLGFLFGIPRVEQGAPRSKGTNSEGDADANSETTYRQTVNTNLTEISDWLTKIIVGVSLVQLTNMPPAFQSLVEFLSGTEYEPGFVGSVLVFFGVLGFLSGYLLTRLFLASAFSEADRSANRFNLTSTELPTQDGLQPSDETLELILYSPREAVLSDWALLLDASRDAIRRKEPNARLPRLANSLRSKLMDLNLLDDSQAKVFDDLRKLRDIAVHSSQAITQEAASKYVNNVRALIESLNSEM